MDRSLDIRQVRRHPERGHYDRAPIDSIIDEAYFCHVSTIQDGVPITMPTLHVRVQDQLYIHGAVAAGLFSALEQNTVISVTITLMDGLVLARSWYNHSANYRSVVVIGVPAEATRPRDKLIVLKALADKIAPGRWEDARQPNPTELKRTRIFGVSLATTVAKVRSGPPTDDPSDLNLPTWAGIVPLTIAKGTPVGDPNDSPPKPLPDYLKHVQHPNHPGSGQE